MPTAGKDYKRRNMPKKNAFPGYLWLLAGLAIGLFFAFLVYLDKQPKEKISFTEAVTQELDKVKARRKEKKSKPENASGESETEFSFYTILPELEVFISDAEIGRHNNTSNKTSPTETEKTSPTRYILQAGSFRNYDDANTLKASLTLLGMEPSIQSVNINSESWHRVRIGPFNSAKNLHEVRSALQKNNIKTITMALK